MPPSEAEQAIPPWQRLSLVRQIQIIYAAQQPRVTRAVIDHRDKLVHTENVLNWRVEVWQTGKTRGTDKPLYFFRTECLTVGAVGGCKGKGREQYATPQRCLDAARYKVKQRESAWREHGRQIERDRRRVYKFRKYAKCHELPKEAAALKRLPTITEMLCDEATCPVCRQQIRRRGAAVRSHLRPHVQSGLLQSNQAEEIFSFLVIPAHESKAVFCGSM